MKTMLLKLAAIVAAAFLATSCAFTTRRTDAKGFVVENTVHVDPGLAIGVSNELYIQPGLQGMGYVPRGCALRQIQGHPIICNSRGGQVGYYRPRQSRPPIRPQYPPQYSDGYGPRPCPPGYGGGYGNYGPPRRPYLGSGQNPITMYGATFSDYNPGGYPGFDPRRRR